ncbi:glycoside hydrolase family protein [bacterium]|nr:glycoside hydrolase family protein [bacterium]
MRHRLAGVLLLSVCTFMCGRGRVTDPVFTAGPVDAVIDSIGGVPVLRGPSVLLDDKRLVWGASVVKGDDGRYHMFYSTWDGGPGHLAFGDSWVLNGEIAYAVSDQPDRDFQFVKVILRGRRYEGRPDAWDAQMVHNPHIKRFGRNYYLYYIGSHDPGPQPEESPGRALNKRNRVQQCQQIGVISFDDFREIVDGTFTRPEHPLLRPRTRVKSDNIIDPSPAFTGIKPDNIVVVNPSVVFRKEDGCYLLYFKGNWYDPGWRGVHGVAVSDNPEGPFAAQDDIVFDLRMADGRVASAEDPYVWYSDLYSRFFAVVKDFSGRLTGDGPALALLQSADGIAWTQASRPLFMRKEVRLIDGRVLALANLERPQLLLNGEGAPLVLYAACALEPPFTRTDHGTFNVHIPLAWKETE